MSSFVEGITCEHCGADESRAAWGGKPGGPRYCHLRPCQRVGVDAGHIVRRVKAKLTAPAGDARIFSSEMKLKEAEYFAASRFYAAGALDGEVAAGNAVPDEERELQFLVYGMFLRSRADKKGSWGHFWMNMEQLLETEDITLEQLQGLREAYKEEEERLWEAAFEQ